MNILITNDDGYGSWGIEAIAAKLSQSHKVYIVAPDGNRSGSGMGVNVTKPLNYRKMGERRFTCSGSPVDCVIAGLKTDLVDDRIDLVVSGINHGPNLGTDILYSGTCSAATEATLMGVPAIAVSLNITGNKDWDKKESWNFGPLADFVFDNLDSLISMTRPSVRNATVADKPGIFINVNAFDYDRFEGVKITNCCYMKHDGTAKLTLGGVNNTDFTAVFWGVEMEPARLEDSDYRACEEGYVSVSAIIAEPVAEFVNDSNITWIV